MQKNKIFKGAITFSAIALLLGGLAVASAATDTSAAGFGVINRAKHGFNQIAGKTRTPRTPLTDAQKAEMEVQKAAMETKMTAVKTALENADYAAWVAAEKAIDADCPMLEKINADNFSRYAEAHKLRAQADSIMKDLGLSGRGDGGFGPCMMGGGHGQGAKVK